jgi:Tfp pilus assembly protein PilX
MDRLRPSVYKKRTSTRGSVFLLAMISLVVLLILGTSLVQTAVQGLGSASDDRRQMEALSLAESGVDMAITKLYEDYDNINATIEGGSPYTDTFSLAQGDVTYTVIAPYGGIADSCLITSDSTTWTNRMARVRVVASYQRDVSRVFEGAIFSDSPLVLNGAGAVYPDENGYGGDIYANGDITFNGTDFTMSADGSIYTTGSVNWVPTDVPATHVHQGVAPLPMPVIDIDYYQSIATSTYTGKLTLNDSNMVDLSGVIFVKGDVSISGSYTGQAVIVATGRIKVTGSVTATSPTDDTLVLMSPKSITIAGGSTVDGLIYAHSVLDDADTAVGGEATINGAIIADVVRTSGEITITYDDVWKGLPLPGVGKQQWAPLSWEEFYL